jgi:hypothetical protein
MTVRHKGDKLDSAFPAYRRGSPTVWPVSAPIHSQRDAEGSFVTQNLARPIGWTAAPCRDILASRNSSGGRCDSPPSLRRDDEPEIVSRRASY